MGDAFRRTDHVLHALNSHIGYRKLQLSCKFLHVFQCVSPFTDGSRTWTPTEKLAVWMDFDWRLRVSPHVTNTHTNSDLVDRIKSRFRDSILYVVVRCVTNRWHLLDIPPELRSEFVRTFVTCGETLRPRGYRFIGWWDDFWYFTLIYILSYRIQTIPSRYAYMQKTSLETRIVTRSLNKNCFQKILCSNGRGVSKTDGWQRGYGVNQKLSGADSGGVT